MISYPKCITTMKQGCISMCILWEFLLLEMYKIMLFIIIRCVTHQFYNFMYLLVICVTKLKIDCEYWMWQLVKSAFKLEHVQHASLNNSLETNLFCGVGNKMGQGINHIT